MKVLILTSKVPYPPRDGGAIATLGLAQGLADAGADVSMLCLNTTRHPFQVENIPGEIKQNIRFYQIDIDTRIKPIPAFLNLLFSRKPYNAVRFESGPYSEKLQELLISENFDVVQLEGPYMGYYIPVIRNYSKALISLRAHNVEHDIWKGKSTGTRNILLKFYLKILSARIKRLEKKVLERIDILAAITRNDLENLLRFKMVKSIVVPAGIDPLGYPEPEKPDYPSVFFIGALDWLPNQEGLMWFIENVLPLVRSTNPDICLNVAGRNAPPGLQRKLYSIRAEGVLFHGEVDDAYAFMNRYAVFVSPLSTGSGIRIKILEGMMMKRVIVATSIAAEGIPVSDRENIILANEPEEMAKKILWLCSNREEYDRIAEKSREFVLQNFNNLAASKKLFELYRSTIQ